jgi:anti-anti-sigma factor
MADLSSRRAQSSRDLGTLGLRSFRAGDAHVIAAAGAFDGTTMKEVERELEYADGSAAQVIVLDLRRLEFIDSSRLRVVVITGARPPASDTPG